MSESLLMKEVFLEHGARPDVRLFRNASSRVWVGKKIGTSESGGVLLAPGARQIWAGLAEGSSDVIGIGPDGRFVALELKSAGYNRRPELQQAFVRTILDLGGLAGFARTVEEATAILEGTKRG